MSSISPFETVKFMDVSIGIFPEKGISIALSGKDLEIFKIFQEKVKEFCIKLNLPQSTVVVSSYPSWGNFHNYFQMPSKCFSKETRTKLYDIWEKQCPYPVNAQQKSELESIWAKESEIFDSQSDDERAFLIGHELGHAWLNYRFKAFNSKQIKVDDKYVALLRHDRVQEKVCDFIGAYFASAKAGQDALQKEHNSIFVDDTEEGSHPTLRERVTYLSEWESNGKLKKPFSEDLVSSVGEKDFEEAVEIYKKHGR